MCGIIGQVGFQRGDLDFDFVNSGLKRIGHRGPDSFGLWLSENKRCQLGHTRLSIIDLSQSANQPMIDKSNGNVLVYNGEIYNFLQLRLELEGYGICFNTNSDTEVILKMYGHFGVTFINKLDGMFALAIWDQQEESLILARDRIGEKPLYYRDSNDIVSFSSEISCFDKERSDLCLDSVSVFLKLGYLPPSLSFYKDLKQVQPGEYLVFSKERKTKAQYWKRNYKNKLKISFNEAVEEGDRLLNLAVSKRLVADVAVGSLLSGGLDSSIVTAIAAKHKNNIPTFNVKFTEKSFSEHLYARAVSDFVGTKHTEVTAELKKNDFWENIFKVYGAPYSDSSAIPTFLLCRAASRHVRVALSGDGADEIFGGYSRYRAILFGDLLATKNLSFDEYLKFIKSGSESKARKYINKFSSLLKNSDLFGFPLINEFYSFEEISNLLNTNIDNLFSTHWLYEEIKEARENADTRLDRLLYFDNKHYLPGDLLVKTDISSMRNALEVRTPFCDIDLIEFVNALPDSFRIDRNEGKILLKEIARKYIPLDIIERRKKGFTVPLTSWLHDYFIEEFSNTKNSIFDNEISRRVSLFYENPNSNESKLWSLLALNNYN